MMQKAQLHQVVILGGGFGGLYAAKALRHAPVRVTLVDKRNFHLFQPLLYQVATGGVSPGDIAYPLRSVFARDAKPTVSLGVTSAVVCTYGCDDGRIASTRCAVIDAALGDRCRQCRACRTLPAAAGSAHIGLAAGSRPVSPVDPGGFHRSRTTPRSRTRLCGDASPARCEPGTHPC